MEINDKLVKLFGIIREVFDSRSFDKLIPGLMEEKLSLLKDVEDSIQKQVVRTRAKETTSPKNTTLYFSILLETKDLIKACMNILELYYIEHDRSKTLLET